MQLTRLQGGASGETHHDLTDRETSLEEECARRSPDSAGRTASGYSANTPSVWQLTEVLHRRDDCANLSAYLPSR